MHASSCVPNAGSGRFASAQSVEVAVLGGDLLRLLQRLLAGLQERALDQPDAWLDVGERLRSFGVRRIAAWIATRVSGCSARAARNASSVGRADRAVLHVDLDPHADLVARPRSRSSRWPAQTGGVQPDAELGQLHRHRRAQAVLGDGAARPRCRPWCAIRGLGQVLHGLAQQVQADVDVLGLQLPRDRDGLLAAWCRRRSG